MVMPAEHHSVVDVGRPTTGMFVNVVDFAPLGGDVAARDDASAVAQGDRPPLMVCEDALEGAERQHPPRGIERDALHRTRTGDVACRGERDRLIASADVGEAAARSEVFGPH